MSWTTYLTNAAVAGVLAGGTNYLAVAAILHYIMPRKKTEIARRIRSIVASDLLPPEKMRDKMDDPAVADMLRRHIGGMLDSLLARDLPAPAVLLDGHREEFRLFLGRLRRRLLDELERRAGRPEFAQEVIRPFLAARWEELRDRTPASVLGPPAEAAVSRTEEWTRGLIESASLRARFRRALDAWLEERVEKSRNLGDLLPSSLTAAAEELAAAQAPVVMGQLIGVLRQPAIQETISSSIMDAISAQLRGQGILGGLKGAVVGLMRVESDVQGICRRLPDMLRDKYSLPENQRRFTELLREAVRHGLGQELNKGLRSPEKRAALADMAADRLWQPELFERLAGEAGRLAESLLNRPLGETLARLGGGETAHALLDEAAEHIRRAAASPAARELLSRQFDELTLAWLERPLGRLGRFVSPAAVQETAAAAAEEARLMLRERLAELTEESGVWDIVTASIEEYDNKQLSDMIKQLASAELRWVTVLGGVVGILVGLVQTFLQS